MNITGIVFYHLKTRQDKTRQVEWATLGEVCNIKNGKDYKDYPKGDIPVYGTGGIMSYINHYASNKPSVLIPRKGSIENLFYVDKPFWTVDTIYWTDINSELILPKFFYYFLSTQDLKKMNTAIGGVPSLTMGVLNKILIPIPPLAEQKRIVAVLDKFDRLVHDINEGLPAEIDARKKQYEYYRNKLLTFKEVNA